MAAQRKLACSLVASLVLVSAAISNQKTGGPRSTLLTTASDPEQLAGPGEAFDLGDAALSNAVQLIEESEELRDGAVLTRGHPHEMLRDARLPNSPHAEPPVYSSLARPPFRRPPKQPGCFTASFFRRCWRRETNRHRNWPQPLHVPETTETASGTSGMQCATRAASSGSRTQILRRRCWLMGT